MNKTQDKKEKLLETIVTEHIKTAEPIGSKYISENYDLGSPATIRNQMVELVNEGFITTPHISSGRIPTDKGYRFYVDKILQINDLTEDNLELVQKNFDSISANIDKTLEYIAQIVSMVSKYPTILSTPEIRKNTYKMLNMISLNTHQIMVLLITKHGKTKQKTINIQEEIDQTKLNEITEHLLSTLKKNGEINIEESNLEYLLAHFPVYRELLKQTLSFLKESAEDQKLITSGTSKLFEYPEFNEIVKLKPVIHILEEELKICSIMNQGLAENITIQIGEEIHCDEVKDCSIVSSPYFLDEETKGVISVIGPKRMEYSNAINAVKSASNTISNLFKGGGK